jgi:hypothetical protein
MSFHVESSHAQSPKLRPRVPVMEIAGHKPPDRSFAEAFQADMISSLEKIDALKNHDGTWVADLEKIRTLSSRSLACAPRRKMQHGRELHHSYAEVFSNGLVQALEASIGNLRVISKEDWEQGKRQTHPLFYHPAEPEHPFDPASIRHDNSYLGYWDTNKGSQDRWSASEYPGSDPQADFKENALFALVYHPRYGHGYRDERGRLMVFDPIKQEHVPITSDWFVKTMRAPFGNPQSGEGMYQPQAFLSKHAPQLEQLGLLKKEDFRGMTSQIGEETQGVRTERRHITSSGAVMLHGVSHYLGRRFGEEQDSRWKVYEIGTDLGGIARVKNGIETLTHTFRIFHEGDPRLKQHSFGKSQRGAAGAELTHVTPIEESQRHEQGEDVSAFADRVRQAEQFQTFISVSNDLWRNADVRLADLSPLTQSWVSDAVAKLDARKRADVYAFAKTYGLEGVKTLLSAEAAGMGSADAIPALAARLGEPLMHAVIKRYAALLSLTEQTAEQLGEELFSAEGASRMPDRIALRNELLRRSAAVLTDAVRAAEDPRTAAENLMDSLGRYERDMALFAAVFKTGFKGKADVRFEDFRGLELAQRRVSELTPEEYVRMLAIARENWNEEPTLKHLPAKALKNKLRDKNDNADFYLLKKDTEPIAFMRFDERPDGNLHAGSLNVDPALRGSAVGEAFLNACLDKAGNGKVIHADFFPGTRAGMMYVDRLGWAVTGVERVPVGNGADVARCVMRRDPAWKGHLRGRTENISNDYLMSLASAEHAPLRVERFLFPQDEQRFMDSVERYSREGFVMSRYFHAPNQENTRYAVFEPAPESDAERLMPSA